MLAIPALRRQVNDPLRTLDLKNPSNADMVAAATRFQKRNYLDLAIKDGSQLAHAIYHGRDFSHFPPLK